MKDPLKKNEKITQLLQLAIFFSSLPGLRSTKIKKVSQSTGIISYLPAPVVQSVECPLRGTGGHGFDP